MGSRGWSCRGRLREAPVRGVRSRFGLSVDSGVVVAAEGSEVVGLGGASVCPVSDVVDVAPAGVAGASGPGAVSVSGDDGPAEGGGDDPGASAYVDDLRVGSEEDAAQ